MGERIWRICNEVWEGGRWPEKWEEEMIVPVIKKGQREEVRDYRGGMSIMPTLYKMYTAALAERLKDVKGKRLIPPNQAGFRKGMGTLDNIYVLNFLINRQVRKKRKLTLFVNLKAAFDSVDRGILVEL